MSDELHALESRLAKLENLVEEQQEELKIFSQKVGELQKYRAVVEALCEASACQYELFAKSVDGELKALDKDDKIKTVVEPWRLLREAKGQR